MTTERLNIASGKEEANDLEASIHLARYTLAQSFCPGRRVLDIACGEGYGSWFMAEKWGAAHVLGVDNAPEAIQRAEARFKSRNVNFLCLAAEQLMPLENQEPFDLIVSFETLEHVADPNRFLSSVIRLLKPDGRFLCTVPNDTWYYGPGASENPHHLRTFTMESFRHLLRQHFDTFHIQLGAKALGFVNVPTENDTLVRHNTLLEQVQHASPAPCTFIAPDLRHEVNPTNVAYFVGLSGSNTLNPSAAIFPGGLNHEVSIPSAQPLAMARKMKIVLVVDKPRWAFENIAQNIASHMENRCDTEIIYTSLYPDIAHLHRDLFSREQPVDLVHFFWRASFCALFDPEFIRLATEGFTAQERDDYFQNIAHCAKTTSVYDHMYLEDHPDAHRVRKMLAFSDGYTACSARLAEIYRKMDLIALPATIITDGIDLELFQPENLARLERAAAPDIRIGWAGNGDWGPPDKDHKGLKTIIQPLVEQFRAEGFGVVGDYQNRQNNWINREYMPDYYNRLDIYICASLNEGTPNPILEAMACGLPILTTDVGIVREVLGPLQQEFIVHDRTHPEFREKLKRLITEPDLRRRLSEENLMSIRSWDWKNRSKQWLAFFTRAINTHAASMKTTEQWSLLSHLWETDEKAVQLSAQQAAHDASERAAQHAHIESLRALVNDQNEKLNRPSFRLLARISNPLTAFLHRKSSQGLT